MDTNTCIEKFYDYLYDELKEQNHREKDFLQMLNVDDAIHAYQFTRGRVCALEKVIKKFQDIFTDREYKKE